MTQKLNDDGEVWTHLDAAVEGLGHIISDHDDECDECAPPFPDFDSQNKCHVGKGLQRALEVIETA